MNLFPVPRDGNNNPILDRGTELYTVREAGIDTGGTAIALPLDCKEILVHVEGSTVVCTVTGNAADSEAVNLTSDGYWLPNVPICVAAGATVLTLAAPSATIDVSIWAVR